MKQPRPIEKTTHPCHGCDETVTEDRFCQGCGVFVCEACDKAKYVTWEHEPEDHCG